MVQKKLERVIEECCAAVPLLTKLAFTKVAQKFDMTLDEFLTTAAKAVAASNMFGEATIEILVPELVTMEDGIYALNNYCEEIFSELYRETFNEEVEITDA